MSLRILGFGTYDRRNHPRVGVLLDGLSQLGAQVDELNAPLVFGTADRVAVLNKPWLAHRLVFRLLSCWGSLVIGRLRLLPRHADAVLVGHLGHFDVLLARLLFPRTLIVLDLLIFGADTARDRGETSKLKLRILDGLDHLAIRCASLVLIDTDESATLIPVDLRHKTVVVPVGAPPEWFGHRPAPRGEGTLKVVFFGLFTPLQGAPVIASAIRALDREADIEFTLVGSGQDLHETRQIIGDNRRVSWIDWVDPDKLPELVAEHEVCLGIFADTPKALRVVPNKAFQGAAAGCALVTSDTIPQRRLFGDAACYVPVADPATLANTLLALAADQAEVQRLRLAGFDLAQRAFRPAAIAVGLRDAIVGRMTKNPGLRSPARTGAALPPLSIRAWLRFDVVDRALAKLSPNTVLEIGCGQGAAGARLANRYDYVGVEPDDASFAVAEVRIAAQGGSAIHGTHSAVPLGAVYDLVCAFEVLEHIEDDHTALADWFGLVRPGGHLLLSVPAFQERFGPMDENVGHFRRYSPAQLTERLTEAGFVDPDITVYGWPLGYALEAVRNRVDARRLAAAQDTSAATLTAASGRTFQPPNSAVGQAIRIATIPFRLVQRARPHAGIGLVAVARRP